MPRVARIGDGWEGICCCHPPIPCIPMTGEITSGNTDHESGGSPIARIGDTVTGACGHTGVIDSGASTHESGGSKVARVGDSTTGCLIGEIVEGNPTHESS